MPRAILSTPQSRCPPRSITFPSVTMPEKARTLWLHSRPLWEHLMEELRLPSAQVCVLSF